ncbi:MAG TPA: dTDP-4-dehydrorhamnose 3,5-epimerase [Bacteroidales bacterium]|nr:dTDP-4-dehydrorhamnose 3,5-epimerase [Bacteroidales bacterium]
MELTETGFKGLVVLKPKIFEDSRGYFYESYNKKILSDNDINLDFVQDNQSLSSFGTIRGLHYQLIPYAQTKLVRVILGSVYDVAVDIRKESPTFGKWFGIELTDSNKLQMLIPKGFAHGFSVLSEKAVVMYKTDDYYNKESERGIAYNDSSLQIDWKIPVSSFVISEKDKTLPSFKDSDSNFTF